MYAMDTAFLNYTGVPRYTPYSIYAILDIREFAIRYFLNLTVLLANCTDLMYEMTNAK